MVKSKRRILPLRWLEAIRCTRASQRPALKGKCFGALVAVRARHRQSLISALRLVVDRLCSYRRRWLFCSEY